MHYFVILCISPPVVLCNLPRFWPSISGFLGTLSGNRPMTARFYRMNTRAITNKYAGGPLRVLTIRHRVM